MLEQPVRGNVSDFLKANMGSQFVIPVYQRNYTWNPEKETAKLMDDLSDLLQSKDTSHFLGIIIYLENQSSSMQRQLQIVDGQQRMTTIFILLLALKKIARDKGQKDCVGMIDDYFLYNMHSSEDMRLRLKPSVASDDVYEKLVYDHVMGISAKEKESYVYRNYEYIVKRLQSLASKYPVMQILDTLSRIDILQFPLSKNDNAQQIFESINATGAPLTSADLIRNYILMNHTNDTQERLYKMYWKSLEGYFTDSRRLEEFFRYFLAAKTFNLYARKDIYEGFKKYWNQKRVTSEALLKDINLYAVYFNEIYEGEAEDKKVESALGDFRVSASRVPAPFLMELHKMYYYKEIKSDEYTNIIRLVDSYLTRRQLCGVDNSQLARYFPSLLRSVLRTYRLTHQDMFLITKVNLIQYNKGKFYAMPTDEQIRKSLSEVNAYGLSVIRPVLERLEQHQASAQVDVSALNIEHIMPQHPNGYWKKHAGTTNEEEYVFYANLIGNLTLCAQVDNVKMGNEDFAYKKKILSSTSHIRLNTDILSSNVWNKDKILKRNKHLTEQIIRIYPYYDKEEMVADGVDDIVVLSTPTTNARAIYHSSKEVEILPGTTMKAYGQRDMRKMKSVYDDYTSRGIIQEDANGQAHFEQSAVFNSLNDAAQFLMHRGGDNENAWAYEDGRSISQKKKMQRYQQKNQKTSKHENNTKRQASKKTTKPQNKPKSKKNTVVKFAGQS